ncbi:bifunctional riboflavin kinase/FAD synthetase [Parabacteroides sp. PF5-9]|uniref:bifunctional riboflavin kinase/FAD synthetase n=1 Tax=Parabacteroides sp. PF5-9 TaxID=1742404 RepID=UPI002476EB6F|nr:bifunctional riboflavin kinase/FAD synthetase [Parabacteroides sp. PF5-9]MDH6356784.1 riboflavin kinase/FMN adenylyltransferase [Parabacteroides sp. PF5-9]
MKLITDIAELKNEILAATIGFFDGVHLGHRYLINDLISIARQRGIPSAVITFPEHPRAVLHAEYQPKLLNSYEEKVSLLEKTELDYCIILPFTPELSHLSAEQFIKEILVGELHLKTLLVGYDHRFGHDRTEGYDAYVNYGKQYGLEVLQSTPYAEGRLAVSSSEIRRLLVAGEVEDAARLLTYPYLLKGRIADGHKIGRTLGFPTANIQLSEPYKIIPAIGVYAVWVYLEEKRYKGMLYIGDRPTLNNGDDITLEVHILDFSGDIYNNEISVSFVHYVRGDIKFDSLEALSKQLENDRETVRKYL